MKRSVFRELWLIQGFLEQELSFTALSKVLETYKRADAVPEGYHQAQLYCSSKEPVFYKQLGLKELLHEEIKKRES